VAKVQCPSSVTVTFFRALRYQKLTNRFPREKRLTVTRAHFYHGLLEFADCPAPGNAPLQRPQPVTLFVAQPTRSLVAAGIGGGSRPAEIKTIETGREIE
jgi:hypothetical protein